MFLKPTTTVNDWKILMAIIDEYGVNHLIKVFDKLTKLHENNFGLTDFIYTIHGDQRSSNSRFFNNNEELLHKLVKAGISFNSRGGEVFYHPKKWIPISLFLWIIKYEIEKENWTIEKYMDVLSKLEEFGFGNIRIDQNDWVYPHKYISCISYLCSNAHGFRSINKIYSNAEIYIEKENPHPYLFSDYPNLKDYPNRIWKYFLNTDYKKDATWYLST